MEHGHPGTGFTNFPIIHYSGYFAGLTAERIRNKLLSDTVLGGFVKPPVNFGGSMRKLIFVACLLTSSAAFAEAAPWTGNKQQIEVDAGRVKWNCEYRVPGVTAVILFWRAFYDACPEEVEYFW